MLVGNYFFLKLCGPVIQAYPSAGSITGSIALRPSRATHSAIVQLTLGNFFVIGHVMKTHN